jgi:hypothetical protein
MADDIDTSPQSEAQPEAVAAAAAVAETPGDGYGSITATLGTELLRVCPPKAGRFTRVHSTVYDCAGTAHTLTMMVPLDKTQVATDAAAGQAVIKLKAAVADASGTKIAANDYIVVKDETGIFGVYKVASVSGNSITISVSIGSADGSGFVNKVLADAAVWFYGTAADHSKRAFTMKASTVTTLPDATNGWCTTPSKFQPIVIHSDNSTAAGTLVAVSYSNPRI